MNLNDIKTITQKAVAENWSYPHLFDALKEIGVDSYDTDVAKHEIVYHTAGADIAAPTPDEWIALTVAPDFDAAAVKEAIAQVGRRETNFEEFLAEIATAGVLHYRVDMTQRTVTYEAPSGEKHVEPVPVAQVN